MNTWNNYWLRAAIIIVIFMNLLVTTAATVIAYKRINTNISPIVYLLWASYFFVMLTIIITHKKDNMHKAILNCMFLVLLGIPIAGLSMPISLLIHGFMPVAIRGNLYILISLVILFYLFIRHERYSILDAVTKLAGYTGEITTLKRKSSFAKYLMFEVSLFLVTVVVAHFYLS
ncbi:MAG: hypothetical protein NTY22_04135 [Proteobacteria bacterium]|nr:hypothetical protein [Pseudomonadota bacterium]